MAAADDELRRVLSGLKLQETLGVILLQAAPSQDIQVAQAALCTLWNLCGCGDRVILASLASGCVPFALKDVAHLTPEWCARVAWLMAEEPDCCEALRACDLAGALRSHRTGAEVVSRWVQRALGRLEANGSDKKCELCRRGCGREPSTPRVFLTSSVQMHAHVMKQTNSPQGPWSTMLFAPLGMPKRDLHAARWILL